MSRSEKEIKYRERLVDVKHENNIIILPCYSFTQMTDSGNINSELPGVRGDANSS